MQKYTMQSINLLHMHIDYFVNNDVMVTHYNLHFYDLDHDILLEHVVSLQNFSVSKYVYKKLSV